MGELLVLSKRMEVSEAEKAEIDVLINQSIALHKDNAAMINKLTFDSVTALTASEGRSRELAQQGFFKRHWNNFTGKNQKVRAQIDRDITKSQYASQQMIQKLAEQNLLTFDLVTAVNNKLNTLVLENDEEFNQIYKMLGAFFKQTRSNIVQMEARLNIVERNVELLHWNATIEYQIYEGTEYSMLPDEEKMVCIANDFLHRTKGIWTTGDLMLLKSTLSELGLPIKQSISSGAFYSYLIENPKVIDRLFEGIALGGLQTIEPYEAPLIKGVEKAQKINSEEKYILETIKTQLELANVHFNERDLQLSLINQYLKNMAYMNPDVKVNLFDFVLELLLNLKIVNESDGLSEQVEFSEEKEVVKAAENKSYDVVLFTYGPNKYQLLDNLRTVLAVSMDEATKLTSHLPATIMIQGTKEEADEVLESIKYAGAIAKVQTEKEKYHGVVCPESGRVCLSDEDPNKSFSWMSLETFKSFVKVGHTVKAYTKVGVVYHRDWTPGVDGLDAAIKAGVKGKVEEILIKDKQEVKLGDVIMVIRVED